MDAEQIRQMLIFVFMIVAFIIMSLVAVLVVMWLKNRTKDEASLAKSSKEKGENTSGSTNTGASNKQSVFNFMEFDTIDDNMIIQKDGERFLMVIECQGVNYDLMSGMEKTGVEEGFVQFLNTLRNPIQIYIQTRSVNLEASIATYKDKLRKIEEKYNKMKMQYYDMKESGEYSKEQLDRAFFELTKQSNLFEYGRDVINDTERMSLNKNVLNKKYYIIVPYYASELGSSDLDKTEIKSLAFSEIYTRAQSLISSISACGVRAKILRTNELIELLYMAYNRDEAEVFGLDKAIKAGYSEINSTAPDVLDKKMKEIDKYIEEKAIQKAREIVDEAISEKAEKVARKEESMDDIIDEMVRSIIEENKEYLGAEITEASIEKLEENKGGNENGKISKKTTRGRKSTRTV